MIRSILAVLAGIVVLTVLSFAIEAVADPLLLKLFPQALPDQTALSYNLPVSLFTLAYTALSIAVGGYVTALLARRLPVRHAVIMGAIEVVFTAGAMLSFRDQAPLRNWILAMAIAVPAAWSGGRIRARRVPD
jgi:hypothetical protein